ncbi:MAG: L-threonylcarbamoyladenylate synthase [Acidimicrobiia bacterium]|nr:L-threonylcarbamoyladenylate synthase [Acidimicrobiia bacterium]MDH5420619.1 L-threonylcarbamoyladenylate synthase [Acidimicrobiia bacterium]
MNIVTVEQAVALLADGLIVGVPTDTVYGLAVDPANRLAVERLFTLKSRSAAKPIGLLAHDVTALAGWAELPDRSKALLDAHWPGAFTVVCTAGPLVSEGLGDAERKTIGVRIPDHPVARALLERTGPLAVTSANRSGEADCHSHDAAFAVLGNGVAGYLAGGASIGLASTVVDITGEEPVVLRPGPIVL